MQYGRSVVLLGWLVSIMQYRVHWLVSMHASMPPAWRVLAFRALSAHLPAYAGGQAFLMAAVRGGS